MQGTSLKYFLYARKSSEAEDRQAASIEQQTEELQKLIKEHNLQIVDVLTESKSAKQPGRPVFNRMIQRISRGEANAILCWKPDRLARNPIDGGQICWLLQQGTIQQIQSHERAYYPTDNVLMLQLEFGMANQYIRDLSSNVKRGLAKKVREGWLPHTANIGYLNAVDQQNGLHILVKDPVRFPLVKQLWDLTLTGKYNLPKLWRIAKDELKLTTVLHKNSGGKPLSKSGVYRVLTNPFYYGWFEYPKKSGDWYKGSHEPMITKAEFDKVQSLLGRTSISRPKHHRFAFTGLMKCGSCGCSVTAEAKQKRSKNGNIRTYVYYRCTKKKVNIKCREPFIEVKNLKIEIEDKLWDIKIAERFRDWAVKYLHEIRKVEAQGHQIALEIKQKELAEIDKHLMSLTLNFTAPTNQNRELISEQAYQSLRTDLLKQKDQLEQDLNKQGDELEKWIELTERTFNFACYASNWFEEGDEEAKKAILACLGSNLFISGKKLNVSLHPYILKCIESKNTNSDENGHARTEENALDKRKNRDLDPVYSTWRGTVHDVIALYKDMWLKKQPYPYIYSPNKKHQQ